MRIITTQYTLKYRSFEIVTAGCAGCNGKHCEGCHTPETWSFDQGDYVEDKLHEIISKISKFSSNIDWIWVYGGEPLDNDHFELSTFLSALRSTGKKVMLFTRFFEVPGIVRDQCDYIKYGPYDQKLTVDDNITNIKINGNIHRVQLATSNQYIETVK